MLERTFAITIQQYSYRHTSLNESVSAYGDLVLRLESLYTAILLQFFASIEYA